MPQPTARHHPSQHTTARLDGYIGRTPEDTVLYQTIAGQPFSAQCCNGVWMSVGRLEDRGVPECPAPREPGSSFSCGDGAISCLVGESYCGATYDPQGNESFACSELCEQDDCSCFCTPDSFGSCVFEPADGDTLEDGCRCDNDLGAISVDCHYYGPIIPAACERDPSSDDICPNPEISGTVYRCTATADDPDPVPRLYCNFSIRDGETSWHCCTDE